MTTKPNTRVAAKSPARARNGLNLRRKAMYVAVASCFSMTPAMAKNLSDYNYVTKLGSVTSDVTANNVRNINIINDKGTNAAILYFNGGLNINSGEALNLNQTNSASKFLGRIGGGNPTNILGTLSSNGKVYLINNSGIVFGAGATINTAGFVASSLNITDNDFISGRNNFNADVAKPGKVSNAGAITTPNGGFVYLIAPQVENSGVITTPSGEAILAAGNSVELVDSADPALRVLVSARSKDVNLSQLMAQSNGQIFSVLNSGKISANSAVVGKNGKIQLRSAGNLTTTTTSILEAKGTTTTDGGMIRGFANGTGTYAGSFNVSGRNGGKVETSAAFLHLVPSLSIIEHAMVPGGHGGTWLLDPFDYTIDDTQAAIINSAFNTGATSITIDTSNPSSFGISGSSSSAGNIKINSAITAAYGGAGTVNQTLNLDAYGAVNINAAITDANNSRLSVNIYGDIDNSGNGGINFNNSIKVGGNIYASTNSGDITMSGTNNILQAQGAGNSVLLDTKNGSIGTADHYINTRTPNLSVGHIGGSPVANAYVTDSAAVRHALMSVDPANGVASLFLSGGLLSSGFSGIDMYGDQKVITSSSGLTLNQGAITFYGGGVGTVSVAGDLNMTSGTISNFNYGGDIFVAAVGLNMQGGSRIGAPNSGGDTLIFAHDLNVSEFSSIYGRDIGINMDPQGILSLNDLKDLPAIDTFLKSSTVTVSYGGTISADRGLGIVTGKLKINASDGNGREADTFISSGQSMALFTAGDLNITGGNNGSYAGISVTDDLFLKVGGKLTLNSGSNGTGGAASIFVDGEKDDFGIQAQAAIVDTGGNALFMDFPFVRANGWSVDGVDNVFISGTNSSTGIFVRGQPAMIGTNTVVNYGDGITSSVVGAVKSFQAAELLKATKQPDNNPPPDDDNKDKDKKNQAKQCS